LHLHFSDILKLKEQHAFLMPEVPEEKLDLKLVPCARCNNPFLIQRKGLDPTKEIVCDNCIKLEQSKRKLQISVMENVIEVENEMEKSMVFMKNKLSETQSTFNKEYFLEKIKNRAKLLTKSIELLEKIEDTKDEKYIKEYMDLFEKMKQN